MRGEQLWTGQIGEKQHCSVSKKKKEKKTEHKVNGEFVNYCKHDQS